MAEEIKITQLAPPRKKLGAKCKYISNSVHFVLYLLHNGHANHICIIPILSDVLRTIIRF